MPKRDFKAALEGQDRAWEQVPTEASRRRVWQKLSGTALLQGASPSPAFKWALAAAGAAVVLAVVGLTPGLRPWGRSLGGFEVVERAGLRTSLSADQTVAIEQGHCTLQTNGVRVQVAAGARLKKEPRGIRVLKGEARFAVRPRVVGEAPVQVQVSQGTIEVVGTELIVVERGNQGEVRLLHGSIRFIAPSGKTVLLSPGETHRWPEPPPELAPPSPPSPASFVTRPDAPLAEPRSAHRESRTPDVEALWERLYELRNREQYPEAVQLLEDALRHEHLSRATRERVSYELGILWTDKLPDRARACRHWEEHRRRFGPGRYARELKLALEQLDCPRPSGRGR